MDKHHLALTATAELAKAAANHALDLEDRLRHSAASWDQIHDLIRYIQVALADLQEAMKE